MVNDRAQPTIIRNIVVNNHAQVVELIQVGLYAPAVSHPEPLKLGASAEEPSTARVQTRLGQTQPQPTQLSLSYVHCAGMC